MPKFDSTTIRIGQRFNRLTVTAPLIPNRTRYWKCQCECGNHTTVLAYKLLSGHTKSCGCWNSEIRGKLSITHGLARTPAHRRWTDMKNRCYNPNFKQYADWGGRGIVVCQGFQKFETFYEALGQPPASHSIDRTDNEGNYSCGACEECVSKNWPMNVRWVPRKISARNKRTTRWITINGETKSMAEWIEISGVRQTTAWKRLNRGETPEEAFDFAERKRHT